MERSIGVPGGRLVVDHRSWDGLVPHLVAAGYRAVRYDARGWGRSTTDDVEYSNRADLVAVLDALGIGPAALIGNSRGGQIAFDTAVEFPDRVVAVVGVGAGLGGHEAPATAEELALFAEMERLEEAEPKDAEAIIALDTRVWVDGPGQPAGRAPAWIAEQVRTTNLLLAATGHVFGRPIVLAPPAAERLADLRCPVLAVTGLLDVSDVAETARHLEASAPDARAVLLPTSPT